jgi:hypothetical protein
MRSMRPDCKDELEQKLVRRQAFRVLGLAVLPAHLAEFARPVSQDR